MRDDFCSGQNTKSRPQGKTGGILRSFQILAAKIDLAQNETKQSHSKRKPNQSPTQKDKKKKKLTRNPSTHLPQILPAKGALAGNQLWTTDKNGGQAPLSWEANADSRTQTLSGLIGISHFSWEENNTRCPLDPKRSPTNQIYVKSQ